MHAFLFYPFYIASYVGYKNKVNKSGVNLHKIHGRGLTPSLRLLGAAPLAFLITLNLALNLSKMPILLVRVSM